MSAASCLITSDPHFEPPPRTAPFFLPDSATPKLGEVQVLTASDTALVFSALFQSEDADSVPEARLYLDYGTGVVGDDVYADFVPADRIASGSLDDGARNVNVSFQRSQFGMQPGCHRFSLMLVNGGFDDVGCPNKVGEYALQTWLVLYCGESACKPVAEGGPGTVFDPNTCPPLDNVCPTTAASPSETGGSP